MDVLAADYHLLHHCHIGDLDLDADLPGPIESHTIGDSSWAKTAWIASFAVVQGVVRPSRLKRVHLLDRWTIVNAIVQAAAAAAFI
ncbi:MAG TPA: hypothetical protein VGY57_15465, partial [Vicinamibacterales bacterium]|nr:hypothetical protein [Vicinamibacterales bacterium]